MTDLENAIIQFSQQFTVSEQDIFQQIAEQKSWETKFRNIMLLGKQLPNFPAEAQIDDNLVQGCESKVWLTHFVEEQRLYLAISSDAKIVKGLAVIILAALNNKSLQQVQLFDFESYFTKLNLLDQLGPSRANGVNAIISSIKKLPISKNISSRWIDYPT